MLFYWLHKCYLLTRVVPVGSSCRVRFPETYFTFKLFICSCDFSILITGYNIVLLICSCTLYRTRLHQPNKQNKTNKRTYTLISMSSQPMFIICLVRKKSLLNVSSRRTYSNVDLIVYLRIDDI